MNASGSYKMASAAYFAEPQPCLACFCSTSLRKLSVKTLQKTAVLG